MKMCVLKCNVRKLSNKFTLSFFSFIFSIKKNSRIFCSQKFSSNFINYDSSNNKNFKYSSIFERNKFFQLTGRRRKDTLIVLFIPKRSESKAPFKFSVHIYIFLREVSRRLLVDHLLINLRKTWKRPMELLSFKIIVFLGSYPTNLSLSRLHSILFSPQVLSKAQSK